MPDLTPEQAIQTLKGLPEDRQRAILAKLSPEVKQGIMSKLGAPPVAPTGTIGPMSEEQRFSYDYPIGAKGETVGEDAKAFVNDAGVAAYQLIAHPVKTAAGIVASVIPERIIKAGLGKDYETDPYAHVKNPIQQTYEGLNTRPGETAASAVGQGLDLGLAGDTVGPITRALKEKAASARESVRTGTQSLLGAGERAVKGEVARAGETAKTADEAHLDKTQEALHETAGLELQYQQAVKASQDTADAANRALDEQHHQAVQDTLQQTKEKEDLYQNELRKAKTESEEAYAAKLREVEEKRAKAEEDHRKELRQYFEKKAKIERTRAEAVKSYKGDLAKQGKLGTTQERLQDASSELRARVETAREKASKIGNEKYNGVNETLNPMPADMETVHKLYFEAAESLGEAQAQTPLITRIGKALNSDAEFTYKDEQQLYSELGKELSKGTLPGSVYHAYDLLHEGIGKDMQRIADVKGQGAQLTDARNYWRRMKQTFGKPVTLADNASTAIKGANPDFLTDDAQSNRVRLLGSFDPAIPDLVQRIGGLQKGLENLPKETSPRVLLGNVTKKATAEPIPGVPSTPASIPPPETLSPREVAQPTRVEPPDRPEPVEAKLPKPPARVETPDRPESTSVDTRVLREHLVDKWATGESSLNKWQVRALLGGGLSALIDISEVIGGRAPGLGSIATEAFGTAAYTFGPAMVAKLLDKPGFRDWITRPPEGELDTLMKLPNADRITITDGLRKAVQAAQKKGLNVDPKLAVLLGLTVTPKGQKTRQLQQLRDHGRYAQVATHDETGHRIGSNDGETWVDTETGEPVHAQ